MTKLHLCSGDVYLKDYINIDIVGWFINGNELVKYELDEECNSIEARLSLPEGNPNITTLDKYFKYPFIKDPIERTKNKRPFIIDKQMDILKKWDFEDNSVDEIVMVSCIEHFDPKKDLPHIFSEMNRVMKLGGKLIIDWPDLKAQMDEFYGKDDEFLMELIYCNHKHQYAIHHWGFTPNTFPKWLGDNWSYDFRTVVKHDYPMQGVVATKIK